MNNQICPYTCLPVSALEASREHIIPHALGGPNSFALVADKGKNSTYGATVDAGLIDSPLLGMLAASAGVETRHGPATWKAQGELVADGSAIEIVGSQRMASFRFRKPIDVDPQTGRPRGVRGFGADVNKELAQMQSGLTRKGLKLLPEEWRTQHSSIRGGFEHNLSKSLQGLTKIAYLATVWAVGDEFINTAAGGQYRSWIDAEPTAAALKDAGLCPIQTSMFANKGSSGQHRASCLAVEGLLLTGVRLFNEPFFEVTIAVEVPELHLPHGHGWLATIDATAKTFSEKQLVP